AFQRQPGHARGDPAQAGECKRDERDNAGEPARDPGYAGRHQREQGNGQDHEQILQQQHADDGAARRLVQLSPALQQTHDDERRAGGQCEADVGSSQPSIPEQQRDARPGEGDDAELDDSDLHGHGALAAYPRGTQLGPGYEQHYGQAIDERVLQHLDGERVDAGKHHSRNDQEWDGRHVEPSRNAECDGGRGKQDREPGHAKMPALRNASAMRRVPAAFERITCVAPAFSRSSASELSSAWMLVGTPKSLPQYASSWFVSSIWSVETSSFASRIPASSRKPTCSALPSITRQVSPSRLRGDGSTTSTPWPGATRRSTILRPSAFMPTTMMCPLRCSSCTSSAAFRTGQRPRMRRSSSQS